MTPLKTFSGHKESAGRELCYGTCLLQIGSESFGPCRHFHKIPILGDLSARCECEHVCSHTLVILSSEAEAQNIYEDFSFLHDTMGWGTALSRFMLDQGAFG